MVYGFAMPVQLSDFCIGVDYKMTKCVMCGDEITPKQRADLGYRVCLWCGDDVAKQERASWTVVPYTNKGAYMLVTNPDHLKQINPKRTT